MALATTCPRCQTGFRVVPDQLKIRRGLVRCGACRHVFSGLDSLRYVNEQTDLAPASGVSAPEAVTREASMAPVEAVAPLETPGTPSAMAAAQTLTPPRARPPGAALSAERLAAAYGSSNPDIAGDIASQDAAPVGMPAPARPSDPDLRAALERAARDETAFEEPAFGGPVMSKAARSEPGSGAAVLDDAVLDAAALGAAAPEDASTEDAALDAAAFDDAAGGDDAMADTALEQAALAEAARRRSSSAGSLDRPTDLVVLEGLEELDDLETLSLPDYLLEPEVPAEMPGSPRPTDSTTDSPADSPADTPADDRRDDEAPSAPGPADRSPSGSSAAKGEATFAGEPGGQAARGGQAGLGGPTQPGGQAGLGEPTERGRQSEPGEIADRGGATEAGSAGHPAPEGPAGARLGDAPEAWSAALLAPDPSARRARTGDAGGGPEAVDFFATAARAGGFASRRSLFSAVLCMALSVSLAVQLTLAGRDWLASRIPALEPALSALSALVGLRVQAPRELDSLTLESFDVQSGASPEALVMDLLMRNRAPHPVRWPAIEMSLSDAAGVLLVRKVVLPADYLGPNTPPVGAPPNQETALRLALQATGFAPAGFSLKLFYP